MLFNVLIEVPVRGTASLSGVWKKTVDRGLTPGT